ncbi:MAG: TonB-dependent receptor [Nitrospirales bacterium]|nr:MAG: TonB-dependent receptor [Nitrospirales bacterium]
MGIITNWLLAILILAMSSLPMATPSIAETDSERRHGAQHDSSSGTHTNLRSSTLNSNTRGGISGKKTPVQAIKLKPVTVSATRVEKPITAIPNTVTIVEQETITQQTTIRDDVQSILEQTVPGFGPSLRRLNGQAESFRGRNPLYVIDGVPQFNALRNASRDGKTIDPFFLQRIEVIHGSNAIQGVGATGGVVSMVTRSPRTDGTWTNILRAGVTSYDSFHKDGFTYKVAGLTGKKFERFFDVIGGATFHHRGLYFDGNGDRVGLYQSQGDTMDSKSWDVFFKAGFEPDAHQRLQVMVNHFNLTSDGDFGPVIGDRTTGRLTTTEQGGLFTRELDPPENDVTTLSVDYTHSALFNGKLTSQFFYQDFAAVFAGGFSTFYTLTPGGVAEFDQSTLKSKKLGAKFIYSWNGLEDLNMTPSLGFDFIRDKTSQVLVQTGRGFMPETIFDSYAPFAQFDYSLFDRVHLTAGVRYIIAELTVDDFTTLPVANNTFVSGGNPTFQEVLPNGGITFEVTPWMSVYGSYAEGFTMPDVGRVLRAINTPGQDVDAFLNLDPVVTENIEVGIDLKFTRGNIHVSYYRSDSDLAARLQANPDDSFTVEREKTRIYGLDVTGSVDVTDAMVVGLNYSWIQGEIDSDDNGSFDTELDGVNISPNRLNLFTTLSLDNGLSGRVQLSHLFKRSFGGLAARPNADFNGITLVDFLIAQSTEYGQFSLGIENLLDNQYVTYFSQVNPSQNNPSFFAGNGRTLSLFWQHEF